MTQWRKSSHSGGSSQTDCVEVAGVVSGVGVRDSKNPDGGHITIDRASFATLLLQAKSGALDLR
ncbi:hypothetical protein amrb99_01570 [Actinomadura sp. RB99]|uniref:DUF397 domain-containing protein n=1 Tax=Actinomadura sp. RB99 TaxID=2691577 RepID=UPI001682C04E|nr:DUF397 domain-containing protein [Actinomadura sp. RB99]MBD2891254.1 hypothetical protein [Actinomadura sp. RB99]